MAYGIPMFQSKSKSENKIDWGFLSHTLAKRIGGNSLVSRQEPGNRDSAVTHSESVSSENPMYLLNSQWLQKLVPNTYRYFKVLLTRPIPLLRTWKVIEILIKHKTRMQFFCGRDSIPTIHGCRQHDKISLFYIQPSINFIFFNVWLLLQCQKLTPNKNVYSLVIT